MEMHEAVDEHDHCPPCCAAAVASPASPWAATPRPASEIRTHDRPQACLPLGWRRSSILGESGWPSWAVVQRVLGGGHPPSGALCVSR